MVFPGLNSRGLSQIRVSLVESGINLGLNYPPPHRIES